MIQAFNDVNEIFIGVIHRSYTYFKILNKNTRVCTLSFELLFFAQSFC